MIQQSACHYDYVITDRPSVSLSQVVTHASDVVDRRHPPVVVARLKRPQTLLDAHVLRVVPTSATSGQKLLVYNFHRRLLVQQASQEFPDVWMMLVYGIVEANVPTFTIVVGPNVLAAHIPQPRRHSCQPLLVGLGLSEPCSGNWTPASWACAESHCAETHCAGWVPNPITPGNVTF